MTQPHQLLDRALVRTRQARQPVASHFLLDRVAAELAERVAGINRRFGRALDLSPRAGVLARAVARTGKTDEWVLAPATAPALHADASAAVAVADEEWLPFAAASFDLVVTGLGLHRVNDLPGALVQIKRALKPDGLLLAALFAGSTLVELRTAFAEAEAELTGGASPRVMPFADVSELGRLAGRAGLALPVADRDVLVVRYDTPFGLFADLRSMGETNALNARSRRPLRRAVLLRAAEIYAARFSDPDGRIRATFEVVVLTGWHPHESQQQPLRPGSAKARLADALKPPKR